MESISVNVLIKFYHHVGLKKNRKVTRNKIIHKFHVEGSLTSNVTISSSSLGVALWTSPAAEIRLLWSIFSSGNLNSLLSLLSFSIKLKKFICDFLCSIEGIVNCLFDMLGFKFFLASFIVDNCTDLILLNQIKFVSRPLIVTKLLLLLILQNAELRSLSFYEFWYQWH